MEINMKRIAIVLALLSVGLFLGPGTTSADLTPIYPGSETPLLGAGGILDQTYGLGILQRVDDDLDRIWFPDHGNVTVIAKFSGLSQNFGTISDLNAPGFGDDSFVSLFTVPAATNGINLGGPYADFGSGYFQAFIWAVIPRGGPLWTSLPSQNSDGMDHMVTWNIITMSNTWVIGWEESFGGGDQDYNDLVLEVTVTVPNPLPPVAMASASPDEAPPGATITFDHSGSFHLDNTRTLVSFRWDFDEDGIWDVETSDINETPTWIYNDAISYGEEVVHLVTLEVEDDQGRIDQDPFGATVTIRYPRVIPVPTLTQWGMVISVLLVASSGLWFVQRRKRAV